MVDDCALQDAVVAKQYINDFPTFQGTAKYWTGE
jgi:hypothetical protein